MDVELMAESIAEAQVRRIRKEVRRMSISAYNSAWTWDAHPSFNTKGAILREIDSADAALLMLLQALNLNDGNTDSACGIDRKGLAQVRDAVKNRRSGWPLDGLPPLDAVVFGDEWADVR